MKQKNLINYSENIEIPEEYKEFVDFIKNNTLQWDMVLEKESRVKNNQLSILKNWKKHGISPTLNYFGVSNKYMNPKNVKISDITSYEILEN